MEAITDPGRMLNAFTFTLEPFLKCYVHGCYDEAVVGRLHAQFHTVDACLSHDPERVAQAKPFGRSAAIAAPANLPPAPAPNPVQLLAEALQALIGDKSDDEPDGGTRVPRRPRPIVHPPAAGAARPF